MGSPDTVAPEVCCFSLAFKVLGGPRLVTSGVLGGTISAVVFIITAGALTSLLISDNLMSSKVPTSNTTHIWEEQ